MTTLAQPAVTFRRDRFGECWHLVPAGELGPRGRTLCGEPRQGSRLSETYAEIEPGPPDCICARCTAVQLIAETELVSQVVAASEVDAPAVGAGESVGWLPGVSTSGAALDDAAGWYQRALATDLATSGVRVLSLAVKNLSPLERADTHAFTRHTLDATDMRTRPFRLPADTYTFAAPDWSVLVKADQRVVTHAGIQYRVIQVGDLRVPVGAISGVMTLPHYRGSGNARAVLAKATAFVATQLWAPFAMIICPKDETGFYAKLGWHVVDAPAIWCDQPGGRVKLANEVAVVLACQGTAEWPDGEIDLCGAPW